ncbi:MAG: LAGLIDADG family homing endonuclease [Candidatus Omnitrophota bacterium]|nr:hypothetical protein [Candidatus Omnitrophota bacterium]
MPRKRKDLNIEGKNLWYLVGLITSDGNLSSDERHIDITSSDYEFLQNIINLIGIKNKIGIKYGKDKQKSFHVQIGNKNFYDFLLTIGLTQKKSLTIGEIKVPNEFFVDFLRGLIDGDGSIRSWVHPTNFHEQWSLRIYSGSNKFLEWLGGKIKEYFGACGRIYKDNRAEHNYILKFGKLAAQVILRGCYYENNFSLQRKDRLAQQCVRSYAGWQISKTIFANVN